MCPTRPRRRPIRVRWVVGLALLLLAGAAAWYEARTSALQSLLLARLGRDLTYELRLGPSESIRFPADGPFDQRHGFALIPEAADALAPRGFAISSQARWSPRLLRVTDLGCYPIYPRKPRAGLVLLDRRNQPLYSTRYPQRVYANFHEIPELVIATLLFIENREILAGQNPYHNPAVEWDRFLRATFEQLLSYAHVLDNPPGGSTLATQLEKFQHSPGGFTASPREKLRQIASASLRAYLGGRETLGTRHEIVREYVNSVPLAAAPHFGEVIGLGDGLWVWFDEEFERANDLLGGLSAGAAGEPARLREAAEVYKKTLALLVAHRRPHTYLIMDRALLEREANAYLRLLAQAGAISPELRDRALEIPLVFRSTPPVSPRPSYIEKKAANAVRAQLLDLLDLEQLYALDRIDLTAGTTLDGPVERRLSALLGRLRRHDVVDSLHLRGAHLLAAGDPAGVIYSFTLYEATPEGNLLRLQADSYDQPLDINLGAKLDLGSSAKLRTLANYLEIVAGLHSRHAGRPRAELAAARESAVDALRRWTLGYLAASADTTLPALLDAALGRSYSASPAEQFFTGGGVHTFSNFKEEDDGRVLSVREAFRHSVNLVFIRLMRDIVRYYQQELPGFDPVLLQDTQDPRRHEYLERYADKEGKQFLAQFHRQYQNMTPAEALERLAERKRGSAIRLTTLFRSVRPTDGVDSLAAFLDRHLSTGAPRRAEVASLFERYSATAFDLQDRAYILHIDPMELWLVGYLQEHPQPAWSEIVAASSDARQEAYRWLFDSKSRDKQNKRIRIMLEEDAFDLVHQAWQSLGYPFDSFVPSYASAIGSSADRPAALAELIGIIVNEGLRLPTRRLEYLQFAQGTPFETNFEYQPRAAERVMPAAVARVLRGALVDVVENGTARRCHHAFRREDGSFVEVGGKTGTGDHRYETYGRGGRLIESRAVSRAATFVFLIGDRFFGAITAAVPGPEAADYGFTSSLPVHLLAALAPVLMPLVGDEEAQGGERLLVARPATRRKAPDAGERVAAAVSCDRFGLLPTALNSSCTPPRRGVSLSISEARHDLRLPVDRWPSAVDAVLSGGQRLCVRDVALDGCRDNTEMEAFHSRFKSENRSLLLDAESLAELRRVVGERIDDHNRRRRHSALGNRAPLVYLESLKARG